MSESQTLWEGPESSLPVDDLRGWFAARFRVLRNGYPQEAWAKRFGLTAGAVRDMEQGRVVPSRAVVVLLKAIEMQPEFMERAAKEAAPQLAALDRVRGARN